MSQNVSVDGHRANSGLLETCWAAVGTVWAPWRP